MPPRGSVWLDPRLFARLGVEVGDELPLGSRRLRIAGALAHEPDRAGSLFQLAPRLMLNRADLDATGLISPASRAHYHLLAAGERAAVAGFRAWVEARAAQGVEIQGVEDARPEMRRALDRAGAFLGLAAILAVVLAGAAVAVAVHALGAREADASALLRCFGARQRLVIGTLLLRLLAGRPGGERRRCRPRLAGAAGPGGAGRRLVRRHPAAGRRGHRWPRAWPPGW
ncbi:MAG: hypothetical protein U5K43_00470 [Halofilum sp. (in: g-proteobacteria)]|nr:hypothetical protein [Halofilum sp. (in: g-proteobacteria)]